MFRYREVYFWSPLPSPILPRKSHPVSWLLFASNFSHSSSCLRNSCAWVLWVLHPHPLYSELIIFPTKSTPPLHSHISEWHSPKSKTVNLLLFKPPSPSFINLSLVNNQMPPFLSSIFPFLPLRLSWNYLCLFPPPADSCESSYLISLPPVSLQSI